MAAATEADAAERRVTDLYTKAADQLGSDKAPVRLAGMYALERLAQNTPDQRQTIVNVLCAYLRMPYQPPAAPLVNTAEDTTKEKREQERQVRLTAQRILADHLRPGDDLDQSAEMFWPNIELDLTGATLLDLDFAKCHIRTARFSNAQFSGAARFGEARFSGDTWFSGAQFNGAARFDEAEFGGDVRFHEAQFSGIVGFGGARFSGDTWFDEAEFGGIVWFGGARFSVGAGFGGAKFSGDAEFGGARVRTDVPDEVRGAWPPPYVVTNPITDDEGRLPGTEGIWGYLSRDDGAKIQQSAGPEIPSTT